MQSFRYKGFNAAGSQVQGVTAADNREQALAQLSGQGIHTQELRAEAAGGERSTGGAGRSMPLSLENLEQLMAELSILLNSGIKIDEALRLAGLTRPLGEMGAMLADLNRAIRTGVPLSQALEAYPIKFPESYRQLIRAGEQSGSLPPILQSIATDLARRRQVRGRIQQALIYPSVLMVVSLLSVLFILDFVVPKLAQVFSDTAALPWYTALLVSFSRFIQDFYVLPLVLFALVTIAVLAVVRGPAVFAGALPALGSVPLLRGLLLLVERSNFYGSGAILLASGIAVDQAISLASAGLGSPAIRGELQHVLESIRRGGRVADSLRASQIAGELEASLLQAGEAAGQLPEIFAQLAQRNQNQLDALTQRFLALMEPILIVVTGVIVGGIVVLMMLSIVSMNDIAI